MSIKVPRAANQNSQDWGVVFQSIPSRRKNEVVKNLENILGLEKAEAKAILANAPLVFLDDLSFELAIQIKAFFQKLGVVVDATDQEIMKKNCSRISWPQPPDLSFFAKDSKSPVDGSADTERRQRDLLGTRLPEPRRETPKIPTSTVRGGGSGLFRVSAPLESVRPELDAALDQRAQKMAEKFGRLDEEKRVLEAQHAETLKTLKNEFQQRLDEEKQAGEKLSKKVQALEEEVRKFEAVSQERDAFRSRIAVMDEKNRQSEALLEEKRNALDLLVREKEALTQRTEKAAADARQELEQCRSREAELLKRIDGLEPTIQQLTVSLQSRDGALAQSENRIREIESALKEKASALEHLSQENQEILRKCENSGTAIQQELDRLRGREREQLKAIDGLERTIHQMTENHLQLEKLRAREPELLEKIEALERSGNRSTEALQAKDEKISQLEKRLGELEGTIKEKASEILVLTREKEDFALRSKRIESDAQEEITKLRARESEWREKIAAMERSVLQAGECLRSKEETLVQSGKQLLEFETTLRQRSSAIELLSRQKEELIRQVERTAAEAQFEIERRRNRESELIQKSEELERTVQKMKESLRHRDKTLAQFDEQITKLIEMSSSSLKRQPRF